MLREVGRRLMSVVRETDTVARLGGNEFVVVQVAVAQPHAAVGLAERLTAALAELCDIGDGQQT